MKVIINDWLIKFDIMKYSRDIIEIIDKLFITHLTDYLCWTEYYIIIFKILLY